MQHDRAYDLFCQGRLLHEAGRYEEAARLFAQSAEIKPHFKAFELLGDCLLRLGRAADSLEPLQAARQRNRGPRSCVLLAEAFVALGRRQDARACLEHALREHPSHGPARAALTELDRDAGGGPGRDGS